MLRNFTILFLLVAMHLQAVVDLSITLRTLADSRQVGDENAAFFENATTQFTGRVFMHESEEENQEERDQVSLESIYDEHIHALLPLPTMQNSIQLNDNGKVLYRVFDEDEEEEETSLYVYDMHSGKVSEIVKSRQVYPYRINNKDQILYFKPHAGKRETQYTINMHSSDGKDRVIFEPRKLARDKNPYGMNYDEFMDYYVRDMHLGFLSAVAFNDLGQALFSYGDEFHATWLIDSKQVINRFLDKRYRVLGLNQRGDVFIDYDFKYSPDREYCGGIYQSRQKDLVSFPFPSHFAADDYVIMNQQGAAVFPAQVLLYEEETQRAFALLYSPDGQTAIIPSLGSQPLFPQHINDREQVAGFGLSSEGFLRGFLYEKEKGTQEIGTLGGKRSAALALNNQGEVVGFAETADGQMHAFVKRGEQMIDLGAHFPDTSLAYAINDKGWILGIYKNEKGKFQGFLYHETKGFLDIARGLLKGLSKGLSEQYDNSFNVPIGFNQKGQVVGILFYVEERQYKTFSFPEILRFPFAFDPKKGKAVRLPKYQDVIVD